MTGGRELSVGDARDLAQPATAAASTEAARAITEVQGQVALAKQFPRDEGRALSCIRQACKSRILAESALYAFPRGGTTVEGPSIRLVEAIARHWGNLSFGVRELSQVGGVSEVEAFCHDLESNVRVSRLFHVKHERKAGGSTTMLTDARDVYELVANMGARRLRACILEVIPSDVVEQAVTDVTRTLGSASTPLAERIKAMAAAFAEFQVPADALEELLGHNLDATTEPELVRLQTVYRSIRDGMGGPEKYGLRTSGGDKLREAAAARAQDQGATDQHDGAPVGDGEPDPPPAEASESEPSPASSSPAHGAPPTDEVALLKRAESATTTEDLDEVRDLARELPDTARERVQGACDDRAAILADDPTEV